MKIVRNDIDNLNAELSITIEPEDYKPKFKSEIEKYRMKSHLKGFRKGKTPTSIIRKMYGKSILADTINQLLQENLSKYIVDEKLDLLGQPIPSPKQEEIDFELNDGQDFAFIFDMGIAPDVDVKGVDEKSEYLKKNIIVDDKTVEDELNLARRKQGESVSVEEDIEEEDIITLEAKELDGKKLKQDGWETAFTILVKLIDDEKLKKSVLKKKKGDKISFNIWNLEKERDEAYVKKYFLNLDENEDQEIGEMFEATITEVSRIQPAALDEAFFNNYFGKDKVKTEEEAKELLKTEIAKYYENQSKSFFYREIMEKLMELNSIELPDAFMKRWLKANNEELTDEALEAEYDAFTQNLRWTLIKNKIAKTYELEVNSEELLDEIKNRFKSYFNAQGVDDAYLNSVVQRFLENKEEVNKVYDELLANKMFEKITEAVKVKEEEITIEQFRDQLNAMNEKLNPKS